MCNLAFDDIAGYALHRLGNIVHQPALLVCIHQTKQIAGLRIIVIAIAMIVSVGFTGNSQWRLTVFRRLGRTTKGRPAAEVVAQEVHGGPPRA